MREAVQRDLKFFLNLAQQKTLESRRTLFANVADLFISEGGRLSERERTQITAILHDLIHDVEKRVRAALADRLKERADAPTELILLLANDEVEIARRILVKSPVLRDPDLIEIIKLRDREYWLAITLRQPVSEKVSDAIIATQNVDVIQSLLLNPDARLSQSAMAYLVAEAEYVNRLQKPLLNRHDLPPELALRMYWWVSAALRQHIIRNFSLDEVTIDELIEDTTEQVAQSDATSGHSLAGKARGLIERLSEARKLNPELLTQLLRNGRIPAVVAGLAHICKLDERLVQRMMLSKDYESIAILCKEMGFTRNEFASFFLLLNATNHEPTRIPPTELLTVLKFYDDITSDIADTVIRFWRRSPHYSAAIEQIGPE